MPREELPASAILNHPDPLDRPLSRGDLIAFAETMGAVLMRDANDAARHNQGVSLILLAHAMGWKEAAMTIRDRIRAGTAPDGQ